MATRKKPNRRPSIREQRESERSVQTENVPPASPELEEPAVLSEELAQQRHGEVSDGAVPAERKSSKAQAGRQPKPEKIEPLDPEAEKARLQPVVRKDRELRWDRFRAQQEKVGNYFLPKTPPENFQ